MPSSNCGPKSRRSPVWWMPLYTKPGSVGNPMPDCGNAGANVLSARRGMRLCGGSRPVLTQSSRFQQQRPQELIRRERVLRLLTDAERRPGAVRKTREQVIADIVGLFEVEIVSLAVGRKARAGLGPIFVCRVGLENIGAGGCLPAAVEPTAELPGDAVEKRDVGKRELDL